MTISDNHIYTHLKKCIYAHDDANICLHLINSTNAFYISTYKLILLFLMVEKCFSVWMDQYIPNDLFIDFFLVSFIYVYAQKKLHWIYFFIYSCSLVNILRMQISRHITSQASLSLMLFLKYISITPFQMLFCLGSDSTSGICFLGTSHFPFIRRLQRGPLLGAKDNASIPSLTHWTSSFSQITSWLPPHTPCPILHAPCIVSSFLLSL